MFNSLLSAVGHARDVRMTNRNNRGQDTTRQTTKIASQMLLALMEVTALGQKLFFPVEGPVLNHFPGGSGSKRWLL